MRIRGANRNTPDGVHFETVTLVTHGGRPLASRCCRDAARDLLPDTLAPFPDARQAFRVVRERTDVKTGGTSTETAYGITSVPAGRAGPERLPA